MDTKTILLAAVPRVKLEKWKNPRKSFGKVEICYSSSNHLIV